MAVWVDQRARSPNRVGYHSAVGRHLSDGIRDAKLRVVLAEAVDPVALFIGSLHSS